MKTMLLMIVLSLSVTTLTFASSEPGMVVRKQKEPGMYTLIYKAEQKSDLTMIVSDSLGVPLFKELILDSNGFIRSLNFKLLVPGEYSIDVIDLEGSKATQKLDHQMPVPDLEVLVL